jgi:hypothetical protein
VQAAFIFRHFFHEISLVLQPIVVVPLKDIHIFLFVHDIQAGPGFVVLPATFERFDKGIFVEWIIYSQCLDKSISSSRRDSFCVNGVEESGCSVRLNLLVTVATITKSIKDIMD